MTYSKKHFSKDLEDQLNLGYDPERIGSWAHTIYLDHCGEMEKGLRKIIIDLSLMEEGPEFEPSESELRELVASLRGPPEKPPQTQRQYELWKSMVDAIDGYLNNEIQDFSGTVSSLEKALDPAGFNDVELISEWYNFWAPLERRLAAGGDTVDKAQVITELMAMKDFLLWYLAPPAQKLPTIVSCHQTNKNVKN